MRRFGVPYSIYLVMIMNTIYALAREPVSYHTVRIDNLDIFYREAGPKNAPVLLLLHGVPTSSRMYQRMLESPLNARYRLGFSGLRAFFLARPKRIQLHLRPSCSGDGAL